MFDTTTTITELNFLFVIDGIFKSPRYKLPFFFNQIKKKKWFIIFWVVARLCLSKNEKKDSGNNIIFELIMGCYFVKGNRSPGSGTRGQVSPPVQSRETLNRAPPLPRPTEEQFRPSLIGRPINNQQQQSQPPQFVQPPPINSRQPPPTSKQNGVPPQQRQPIATSAGLPIRPSLGRPITTGNPANANFNPAPSNFPPVPSTVSLTNAQRPKIIQPDCDLFSEGICLDVRNYPT